MHIKRTATKALIFVLLLPLLACTTILRQSHFYETKTPNTKLIVFIHGVLGDYDTTWRNADNNRYWPKMVSQDPQLSEYDVYIVSYESPSLSYSSNISEIANRELQQLIDKGVFERYDQVHFITHSMGGLIAKRMLVTLNRPEYLHLLAKVRSVLFLATPAQGSNLGKIVNWFSSNPQFANLAPSDLNAYLQTLEDDWQSLLRSRNRAGRDWPKAFCAYETKPLSTWLFFVVSRIDAASQCDDNRLAIDTDHINIVKPSSPDEQPYPWARARILESSRLKGPDWQEVILMDSSFPGGVYDSDTKQYGGTNADDLAQALQPVNVRTIKELVHPLWNREEQIKKLKPALVIVHFSSFYTENNPGDTDHRFQSFVDSLVGSRIKLLVYTRKPEVGDEHLKDNLSDIPELHKRLKAQLTFLAESQKENLEVTCYLLEQKDGKKTFRNPVHARKIRSLVKQTLGLGDSVNLPSCADYSNAIK